jgi:hypothetical protein
MDTNQVIIIVGGIISIVGILKTIAFRYIDKNKGCSKVDCVTTITLTVMAILKEKKLV